LKKGEIMAPEITTGEYIALAISILGLLIWLVLAAMGHSSQLNDLYQLLQADSEEDLPPENRPAA
jgi:hypothetical protein